MVSKKYYNVDDLKRVGMKEINFQNNIDLNKMYLTTSLTKGIGKGNYSFQMVVETNFNKTLLRTKQELLRLMLEEYDNFLLMGITEQKKYALEHGEKIDPTL